MNYAFRSVNGVGRRVLIECPLCGMKVHVRGLASHKGSNPCHAASVVRRYRELGYGVFPLRYRRLVQKLKQCGWIDDVVVDIYGWIPGSIRKRGFFTDGIYVRPGQPMDRMLGIIDYLRRHPQLARELLGMRSGDPRKPLSFSRLADILISLPDVLSRVEAAMVLDNEGSGSGSL